MKRHITGTEKVAATRLCIGPVSYTHLTVRPDYDQMIQTATKEALRKMVVPSVLAILVPVVGGFLFGIEFVGGLLIGATVVAIPRAIFMGNSGGAFDNAKKYIESGMLEGHGKKDVYKRQPPKPDVPPCIPTGSTVFGALHG